MNLKDRIARLTPEKRAVLEREIARRQTDAAGRRSIPRRRVDGPAVLSYAQQRLWFIHQVQPESALYNVPRVLWLRGPVDTEALQHALQEIVSRHEVLRTNYVLNDGDPIQIISSDVTVPLPCMDVSAVAETARKGEALRLCREETARPFDLTRDRMVRGLLLKLAEEEHILVLTMHHIVSDGWSNSILTRELSALYNAFREGQASPLPPLPIQYADYAAWQREWLQGEELQRQAQYWRSRLTGAPPVLELPTDRPRELARSHRGDCERLLIAAEQSQKLLELGRDERATQFMVLLAVFNVLLYSYTDQQDMVVGTDEAGRNHRALEGLIGFFINHLVLRTDVSGNPTFRQIVRRVREVCLGAYSHQDFPFDKLVDLLRPDRATSHTPLFQVLFVMQPATSGFSLEGSVRVSGVNLGVPSSKYDIVLFVGEGGGSLLTSWVYRTDLFDAGTIRGMAEDFEAIVGRVGMSPDTPLAELKVLLLDLARRRSINKRDERRMANRAGLRPGGSSRPG